MLIAGLAALQGLVSTPFCACAAVPDDSGFELLTPNKHLIQTTYVNNSGTVLPIHLLRPLRSPPDDHLQCVETSNHCAVNSLFTAFRMCKARF